jgi:hypothetical protein
MSWNDIVGYSAALAVLAAFRMSSIVTLRMVAIPAGDDPTSESSHFEAEEA